ncbi:MAG: Crp/Fnr family transcriptional regulator [Desulfuromonadaceae bacterium]|nr:Crp/Fnr family transcriptional regulator [Desulfuromonadaceae bacterium]
MTTKELLKKCPLFAGTDDADLAALQGVCTIREHSRGDLLFSEGEEARGFYVVASGKVKVYKLSPEGKERILHIVHPGDTFAEAAIFADGAYPAHAEPLEKSQLMFFPKRDFLSLLSSNPRIALNMIAGLSRFLRQFATQIESLTFKDVPARLAHYLLELAGEECSVVQLPISKAQLASNLGTVGETLSRTLRKLADDAVIEVNGRTINILDADRLIDLAEKCRE